MYIKEFFKFINNPKIAFFCTIILLIGLLLFLSIEGNFTNNFFTFGPSSDDITGKPAQFMGIYLSNWHHVIIVYLLVFFTTILHEYYGGVISLNIKGLVTNEAIKTIPYSKLWSHIIIFADPFINIILYVIRFYATATLQVQYILPQFIGSYIVNIPILLHLLQKKIFI